MIKKFSDNCVQYVALVSFNSSYRVILPFQLVSDENCRRNFRATMDNARHIKGGGTSMYSAINYVLHFVSTNRKNLETWIVCLTDGESGDSNTQCITSVQQSPSNVHIIVIGVGLNIGYHSSMTDLCRKYSTPTSATKGFFIPTASDVSTFRDAFKKVASRIPVSQTFALDGDLTDRDCHCLIEKHLPKSIEKDNMLLHKFWIQFLYRRVKV